MAYGSYDLETILRENALLKDLVAAITAEAGARGADWVAGLVARHSPEAQDPASAQIFSSGPDGATTVEELRKSEEWHRNLILVLSYIIWTYEVDEKKQLVASSGALLAERLIGLPSGTLGNDFNQYFAHIHIDDLASVSEAFDRALSNPGHETVMEYRLHKADGSIAWMESHGISYLKPDGHVVGIGTTHDITEKRKAEEALRESEAKYRLLADNTADCIWILDTDLVFRYINPAIEKMMGFTVDEWVGTSLAAHCDKANFGIMTDMVAQTLAKLPEHASIAFEAAMLKKDGTPLSVEILGSALLDAAGKPVGFQGVTRDISRRKEVEATLAASSAKLEAALASMTDAVFITDTEGRFIHFNEAFATFHKFTLKAECADSFSAYTEFLEVLNMDGEVIPVSQWGLPRALKGETASGEECWLRRKDTGESWMGSFSFAPIREPGGEISGAVAVGRDITAQREAQEALRESENRFSRIFRISPAGHSILSYPDSRIIDVNEAFCRIVGYSRDEMIGRTTVECGLWVDVAQREAMAAEFSAAGRISGREVVWRTKSGSLRNVIASVEPMEIKGKPCVISTALDITKRKRAEHEYRMLFNEMLDGFALHEIICDGGGNPVDYRFLAVNPAFEKMTGLTAADVLGKTVMEVMPETEPYWIESYGEVALTGKPAVFENFSRAIGKHFSVTAFQPVRGRFACIFTDITGQKEAEAEKNRLQAQLSQAQKMESIGRLAGGVAHDFNNMLSVILGHAEIALGKVDPQSAVGEDLVEIRKAARRSADLTRQLLGFARKQTVAPKVLDLNETVEGMFKMLRRLIGEDINLTWLPGGGLWPVKIDPAQIDQILANLCVNAKDAIGGQGLVVIETTNIVAAEAQGEPGCGSPDGRYVMLSVSDNGCGMEKETLENLFEPFFTTKEVGKGTGLGLANVYGIVKQNGGFINVYSRPGTGTTFKVCLPALGGETGIHASEPCFKENSGGTETILMVEDEPAILKMASILLGKRGYRVLAAADPETALRIAESHDGEIHLLLTDVVMPHMNGPSVADRLARKYPDMKCLFMSGYSDEVIAHHGILGQGLNLIQKPFSMRDLAERVRQAISGDAP